MPSKYLKFKKKVADQAITAHTFPQHLERTIEPFDRYIACAAAKREFQSRTISLVAAARLVIFVTYLMMRSVFAVGGRIRRVGSYALGRLRLQGQRQAWGLRTVPASRWRWRSNQSVQTRRKRRVRFEHPPGVWYIVVAQLTFFAYFFITYVCISGGLVTSSAQKARARLTRA